MVLTIISLFTNLVQHSMRANYSLRSHANDDIEAIQVVSSLHSHFFTVTLDFFVSTLGRFSVMNLVVFQSLIIISFFSKCEQVDAIYLDFSKAFDQVRHPHLLPKLWYFAEVVID